MFLLTDNLVLHPFMYIRELWVLQTNMAAAKMLTSEPQNHWVSHASYVHVSNIVSDHKFKSANRPHHANLVVAKTRLF